MYKNVRTFCDWVRPMANRARVRLANMPPAMKLHLAWVLLVVVALSLLWPRLMLLLAGSFLFSATAVSVYHSVHQLICYFRESDHE